MLENIMNFLLNERDSFESHPHHLCQDYRGIGKIWDSVGIWNRSLLWRC